MSKAELLAELPKLSSRERRELVEAVFDLEAEAGLLHDCDRRADERFLMLDALEAEHGQTQSS
ncbi:MAG: hypothetical protein FJ387_29295 [Verrucomicrobia bacterium]|nr:hypothetical protein [Verrucomicrobiota bacterium]